MALIKFNKNNKRGTKQSRRNFFSMALARLLHPSLHKRVLMSHRNYIWKSNSNLVNREHNILFNSVINLYNKTIATIRSRF